MASYSSSLTDKGYRLTLTVTEDSTSTANNTSNVSWVLKLTNNSQWYYFELITHSYEVRINGSSVLTGQRQLSIASGGEVIIGQSSTPITIPHNADGTKTIACYASLTNVNASQYPDYTKLEASGNMVLTSIPRASTFTVSSCTLGQNPTFTVTRASSSFTHSLYYTLNGVDYAIASGIATSYSSWTVPLSAAGYAAAGTTTVSITFKCLTYNGSSEVGQSTVSQSFTIPASTFTVNSCAIGENPTFTISRAASNLTHSLFYRLGNNWITIATGVGASYSGWTAPASIAEYAQPGETSVNVYFYSHTYNGSAKIGEYGCHQTISIHASTFVCGNGTLGSAQTVTVSRVNTGYTHRFLYSTDNGASWTVIASGIGSSYTWTPPLSWAAYKTDGASFDIMVGLETYNGGTYIGSSTKTITMIIPSTLKPSFGTVTTHDSDAEIAAQFGCLLRGKSALRVVTSGCTAQYGASVTGYRVTFEGKSYSGSDVETAVISDSGSLTGVVRITDSRGNYQDRNFTVSVEDYSPPRITSFSARRVDAQGNEDDEGQYLPASPPFRQGG